jgi:dolichol-phosphate hexosyltransferase
MQPRSTALVLLSYDEREALEKLLPMIPFELFNRVLAIDAGSTDGTLELYRSHEIAYVVQEKRGRGNAVLQAAQMLDTERVVFLSTDGNENPEDLPTMLKYLDEGYDLVIGGRFILPHTASDDSDDPIRIRKISNITTSLLVRALWRTGVWDAINGYRGFQLDSLRRLRLDAPLHEIEIQSTIRAAKLGMRIKEFPTRELRRMGGWRKPTAGSLTLGWRIGMFLVREIFIGKRFNR